MKESETIFKQFIHNLSGNAFSPELRLPYIKFSNIQRIRMSINLRNKYSAYRFAALAVYYRKVQFLPAEFIINSLSHHILIASIFIKSKIFCYFRIILPFYKIFVIIKFSFSYQEILSFHSSLL